MEKPYCLRHTDKILKLFLTNDQVIPLETAELKQNFDKYNGPFICRGIGRLNLIDKIIRSNKDFYYLDSGYFENKKHKTWHRITKNNLQNIGPIINRDEERLKKIFNINNINGSFYNNFLKPWKKGGGKILLCPSNEKYLNAFGINYLDWIQDIKNKISLYTDKEVVIRDRPILRSEIVNKSLSEVLSSGDFHALVTHSSNAGVESIINGVPAFILGISAALPVSLSDLSKIEEPIYPDRDMWIKHLSYCQFSNYEIEDGTALRILMEQ